MWRYGDVLWQESLEFIQHDHDIALAQNFEQRLAKILQGLVVLRGRIFFEFRAQSQNAFVSKRGFQLDEKIENRVGPVLLNYNRIKTQLRMPQNFGSHLAFPAAGKALENGHGMPAREPLIHQTIHYFLSLRAVKFSQHTCSPSAQHYSDAAQSSTAESGCHAMQPNKPEISNCWKSRCLNFPVVGNDGQRARPACS